MTRINTHKRQLANKRIGHDFKSQRGKRLLGTQLAGFFFLSIGVASSDGLELLGGRKVRNNSIQQLLDPFILERGPTQNGCEYIFQGSFPQGRNNFLAGYPFATQKFLHNHVIDIRNRLNQFFPVFPCLLLVFCRDIDQIIGFPLSFASEYTLAFISTRSITPRKSASAPKGS